ncbi:hypothetical protein [Parasporobacterium paucivorans]|uniref:Uncharacterized protein n=1 Tax=Parasporobacterium paucivorans DSM 15970 TaxID=1122934 RepID=A0A1M6HUA1_9FIRM|nr:hypothetical protein [Parasporobacterium paucivorans]SHJ25741.1 hypothetical protein SAMN02745691_01605 [Parasporobacterium paucivorans DSM 15970]
MSKICGEIIIPDALRDKLEQEGILYKHISRVIENAEEHNDRIFLPEKGSCISHLQIGSVTFWVEYFKRDKNCTVQNAYCHRIQIEVFQEEI